MPPNFTLIQAVVRLAYALARLAALLVEGFLAAKGLLAAKQDSSSCLINYAVSFDAKTKEKVH